MSFLTRTVVKLIFISTSALIFLELTSRHEKQLSRTPKEAALPMMTSESDHLLAESDEELEENENYPTEVIEEALKSASSIVKEFLRRPVRIPSNPFGDQISKRDTPGPEKFTQKLCPAKRTKWSTPGAPRRSAESSDESLYLPLNVKDKGDGLPEVFQEVWAWTCENEGLNTATNSLQGYDHWCKQEYMNLPLVALVPNTTTLAIKRFWFPTTCSCYLEP